MPITARPIATVATLVCAAITFAGCAATAAPQTDDPTQNPVARPAPEPKAAPTETDADACTNPGWIGLGSMTVRMSGELQDRGARTFAEGDVELDAEGNIVSYTVAPGDVPAVIGERLCLGNGSDLPLINHVRTIQPDQVLWLRPDPDDPWWVPYFNPEDAPAGFHQIPYQRAIEAMGAAADAGDVATMRSIWTDRLSAMFSDQDNVDLIARELKAGDLDVLRQMFS